MFNLRRFFSRTSGRAVQAADGSAALPSQPAKVVKPDFEKVDKMVTLDQLDSTVAHRHSSELESGTPGYDDHKVTFSYLRSQKTAGNLSVAGVCNGTQSGCYFGQRCIETVSVEYAVFLYQLADDGTLRFCKLASEKDGGMRESICCHFVGGFEPKDVKIAELKILEGNERNMAEVTFSIGGRERTMLVELPSQQA